MASNVTKYMHYPQRMLIFFGIWPTNNRTIFTEIYTALVILEQYLFLLFNGVYIFMMRGDLQAMADSSYLFFTQLALCCRATAFSMNRESVRKVLSFMEEDIFKSECNQKSTQQYALKCRNLYIVFTVCIIITTSWWTVAPLLSPNERRYPYNEIWFPVDMQTSPQYELAYIYEVFAMFSSGFIYLSVDMFLVATMLFSCAQFDVLKEKMKKMKPVLLAGKFSQRERQEELNNNYKLLVEFIQHHQAVNRFVEQVEDTIHLPMFFQLCTTVMIICIIALRLAEDSPTNPSFYGILNYFILMSSELYLYCWCGTELTEKSLDFRDWLYELPWYEQDKKFNTTLCILLLCTRKPLAFRAGHYVLLARATFVSVLRCSYSYFAVLQQANE